MNNPELYLANNKLLRVEIEKILEIFADKLRNCDHDAIADIGCAAGDSTSELLAKKIGNFRSIVGFDIVPEFVTAANDKFKSSKITFEQLDISTFDLPKRYVNRFDKIFSFTCLHLVSDIRQAYKNICDMLTENGEMFILSIISHPFSDVFLQLAESDTWSKFIDMDLTMFRNRVENRKNIKHFLENLQSELTGLGFHVKDCKHSRRSYTMHRIADLQNYVTAINPFMNQIPTENVDEFVRNCVDKLLHFLRLIMTLLGK